MIPHAPPMRFELEADGAAVLPESHPLAVDGAYPAVALVELAAQLAGRRVQAPPGHGGMLVEVRDVRLHARRVPAGTRLVAEIEAVRDLGPLRWFRVRLPGVLDADLTLLVR